MNRNWNTALQILTSALPNSQIFQNMTPCRSYISVALCLHLQDQTAHTGYHAGRHVSSVT